MSVSVVKRSSVKCGEVLQCSDSTNNKVSDNIVRQIDNRKLLLIQYVRILLLSYSFLFFRFYFLSIYGCIPV